MNRQVGFLPTRRCGGNEIGGYSISGYIKTRSEQMRTVACPIEAFRLSLCQCHFFSQVSLTRKHMHMKLLDRTG